MYKMIHCFSFLWVNLFFTRQLTLFLYILSLLIVCRNFSLHIFFVFWVQWVVLFSLNHLRSLSLLLWFYFVFCRWFTQITVSFKVSISWSFFRPLSRDVFLSLNILVLIFCICVFSLSSLIQLIEWVSRNAWTSFLPKNNHKNENPKLNYISNLL